MPTLGELQDRIVLRNKKGSPLTNNEMDSNLLMVAELLDSLKTAIQTIESGGIRSVTELSSTAAENEVVFLVNDWSTYKGQNLYQFKAGKWEQVVPDVPDTVVIGDNSITTPKLAARAITADKMAVNSITAGNAAIANAAVGTLSIAGNAVTLCQSARDANQKEVSLASWQDALSFTVTVAGTQPMLVWATWTALGCKIGTASDYTEYYWGKYWKYHSSDTGQDARAVLVGSGGTETAFPTLDYLTVPASSGTSHMYMGILPPIAAGTYTLKFQFKRTAGIVSGVLSDASCYRYLSVAMLETRR